MASKNTTLEPFTRNLYERLKNGEPYALRYEGAVLDLLEVFLQNDEDEARLEVTIDGGQMELRLFVERLPVHPVQVHKPSKGAKLQSAALEEKRARHREANKKYYARHREKYREKYKRAREEARRSGA